MDQLETQTEVAGPGKVAQVGGFLVATRTELEKVSWPSREELIKATKAVVYGALMLGVVIGLMDFLLQKVLVDFVAYLSR
jgi:preprotein translocase SecE subunit